MTRTQIVTLIWAVICGLAVLDTEVNVLPIPQHWKPVVGAICAFAMWLRSHKNLFLTPEGTPIERAPAPEK